MTQPYPSHWQRGALLDLKRFSDGTCRATLLGETADPKLGNELRFDSTWEAQAFISSWYARPFVPRGAI